LPMCVSKHSTWMNPLALRPENASIRSVFFVYKNTSHPRGRPFAVLSDTGSRCLAL